MELQKFENAQAANTELSKRVTQIGTKSESLDTLIHETLCLLLVHIRDHGDTTLLTRLLKSLPKGSRLKSFFAWCEKFAPLKVSKAKDTRCNIVLNKVRDANDYQIKEASETSPWSLDEHKNPSELRVLEFEAIFNWVVKQAKKTYAAKKCSIDQVRALSDRVAAELVA